MNKPTLILVLILIGFAILSCDNDSPKELELIIENELIQTPATRNWKEFVFNEIGLDSSMSKNLNQPAHIRKFDR